MGDVTWGLATDCPPDGNGVPLNSSASGLPTGVIYSFSRTKSDKFHFRVVFLLQLERILIILFIIMPYNFLSQVWSHLLLEYCLSLQPQRLPQLLVRLIRVQLVARLLVVPNHELPRFLRTVLLVRYDFTNTWSQVLQASVTGLPPGSYLYSSRGGC